ncbi:ethanolamine kinase 1-like [Saccostrea echinata]|uniref:ethanolamine kinase 1-like n=1 Tax=Saccostrea echinata TaxID=191078 RepID=UPI002A81A1D3|nr:ethanolamine kinase 1-like [Saccostrea echinata]
MTSIPDLNYHIDDSNIYETAKDIIMKVKPSWERSNLKFKVFDEGITNKLIGGFQESSFGQAKDIVLIRVYGEKTDLIIDRNAEKKNMAELYEAGLCPPLYATFENGLAYGFAPGVTLDEKTVRDETIRKLIAKEMARLHIVQPKHISSKKCALFDKLKEWLKLIPESFSNREMNEKFKKKIPPKENLEAELLELEQCIESLGYPTVFSHNDLLLKNIIYNKEEGKVTFIDQEYGMYNYQPFDIGNHFCEYAGIGEVTDYSLYPDKEYQLSWIREYLEQWSRLTSGPKVTDTDVRKMYCGVNKCALAAHFFWGVWGIIQAKFSAIDFDYLEYAVVRFNEYFARKNEFLALQ